MKEKMEILTNQHSNRNMWLLVFALGAALTLTSCSSDDDDNPDQPATEEQITDTEMQISGTWKSGQTITLDRHLVVPQGKSLTIEPGVNIIVSRDGVGVNHTPIEIIVEGNLYALGTATQPILISVSPELRTKDNAFKGLWGGIVCTQTCSEMALDNVTIEYTGAQVIEGSPAAIKGIYTAGDDAYPNVTTTNINGRYAISNCTIRRGASDGIYLMGGNAVIANNRFEANGFTGAEAVNIKAGVKADIAGNVMYSPNTNGIKISSAGQSETRPQCQANAYNNTIINGGWRRDGEKGGCIYVEKNALVQVVNNLLVNCKFRAMTPNYKNPNKTDGGYDDKSVIDYNFYASGSQSTPIIGDATVGNPAEGYTQKNKNYNPAIDQHSLISAPGSLLDPGLVNFGLNTVSFTDYVYNSAWNLHLTAGAAALTGAKGNPTPMFAAGLVLGGKTYTSPAVMPYFGAFGTK